MQNQLRGLRLHLRRNVAVQKRRSADRDALQEIRVADLLDREPLFDGCLLCDKLGLTREDLRQAVRIRHHVKASPPRVRNGAEQFLIHAFTQAHGRDGDGFPPACLSPNL